MNITIRPEEEKDFTQISKLVFESFGFGTTYSDGYLEEKLVKEIRSKKYYIKELSFVAEDEGTIVGYFMLSKFPVDGKHEDEFLLLSPVAVDYSLLRQGIGMKMLTLGLECAKRQKFKGILVEGNPDFYHIFGFTKSTNMGIFPDESMHLPSDECLMAMELIEDGMKEIKGKINYNMYDSLIAG